MTFERWRNFSKHDQLLHIGAEIVRASVYQNKDKEAFSFSINEVIKLIDLTLNDQKWKEYAYLLEGLELEIKKFLRGERTENIKILYQAL